MGLLEKSIIYWEEDHCLQTKSSKNERTFSNSFYEVRISLILKSDKDVTINEIPIFPKKSDANIL
jgi:hypothetical protein